MAAPTASSSSSHTPALPLTSATERLPPSMRAEREDTTSMPRYLQS